MAGEDWSQGEPRGGWPQLDSAGALWSVGYTSGLSPLQARGQDFIPRVCHQELRVSIRARGETHTHRLSEQSSLPAEHHLPKDRVQGRVSISTCPLKLEGDTHTGGLGGMPIAPRNVTIPQ